jgi:hypothetical protein
MRKFKIVANEDSHCFAIGDIVEYIADDYDYDPEHVAIMARGLSRTHGAETTQTLFTGTDMPDAIEVKED